MYQSQADDSLSSLAALDYAYKDRVEARGVAKGRVPVLSEEVHVAVTKPPAV